MLIEAKGKLSVEGVQALAPDKQILLCDAYIDEIEGGTPVTVESAENGEATIVGFSVGNILNIDHHSPIVQMSRQISSTNLAIAYVAENGPVSADAVAIINHTDCDSILSFAIMRGILEPRKEFGEAAIAADHTGEANEIADLLQSIEGKRDVDFSLRNLELFLKGEPIEPEAEELLRKRIDERERTKDIVANEFINYQNSGIYFAILDERIDAGLLPALIPEAKLIVMFGPMPEPNTHEVKVRLGMAAPDGMDLRKILKDVDPNWGGRWNAGSNKRGGGTTMDSLEYIKILSSKMEQ